MAPPIKSVAIIGAGASGAASASALAAEGYFDVIKVFERREEPGGTWIYDAVPPVLKLVPGGLPHDIDPPLAIPEVLPATLAPNSQERFTKTPIYDGLTTNVPEIAMSLSDRRFPYGPFVPHWIPKNYIREYFSLHGDDSLLFLNTTVEDISQIHEKSRGAHNRWRLTLRKHDRTRDVDEWWQEEFDAVILGNGHYAVPFVPAVTGLPEFLVNYPGRVIHSKSYRSPKVYTGKRVLVIGNSASGHDVADQLVKYEGVHHPVYQSRHSRSLWEGDEPPEGLVWKPVIDEYKADGTIVFVDGTELGPNDVDVIIYCTGYKPSYPFWNVQQNGRRLYNYEENRFEGIFQHTFVRDFPTLGIVGLPRTLTFRSFEYQAIALARLWSGRAVLPPVAEQQLWEEERIAERRHSGKRFHDIEWDTGETDNYLNFHYRLAGLPQLDGKGLTPPILNSATRWALENIKKYPIIRPSPPPDRDANRRAAEDDWVVIEGVKDSLWYI
ncbi:hypothetical protein HMPREF1624_02982 [Sporothrix schenckii ATCC 58251]|uniref:Thiol-specific monooxygenase n=1 Tax=Sporothrix schenckii (strain ATCC 58251 / de Perez 2211183) TaxID=1391915 RepID=U7PVJ9_SPOS1|nr:hypothetical protein HMPREF1624_02982 [Sporothrix schenckii ATCC 58251]